MSAKRTSETQKLPFTLDDLRAIVTTATTVRPREIHVRNREVLLRITGAEIQSGAVTGLHMVSSLPVFYDDTLLADQMDMRDASDGRLLRRWFLRDNGEVLSVDVSRLGELFDL